MNIKYYAPFSCQLPFTYCQADPARMEILQNRDFLFLLTDLCILYREEELKYHKGIPHRFVKCVNSLTDDALGALVIQLSLGMSIFKHYCVGQHLEV